MTERVRKMRCVNCGTAHLWTATAARSAGWELWLGGGLCSDCLKREAKQLAEMAAREAARPVPPHVAALQRSAAARRMTKHGGPGPCRSIHTLGFQCCLESGHRGEHLPAVDLAGYSR